MQSQQYQDSNIFMYTPLEEESLFGNDNILYQNNTSNIQQLPYPTSSTFENQMLPPMEYQYQDPSNSMFPLIPPLPNNQATELVDAVSRMNMEENFIRNEQRLSLDIQPCISITEPTPVHNNMSSLRFVDDFIAQHESQLVTEEQSSIVMDSSAILGDLLMTQPNGVDWLSWTPMRGNSPASIASNSFDDQNSQYSVSPEPSSLYFNMVPSADDLLMGSTNLSWGYPSPSLSEYSDGNVNNNNGNTLTVKKESGRARRVSEPPMISTELQLEFNINQNNQGKQGVRRTQSESKRRGRSNSSASSHGNHVCPHPGCGKQFTRPYNLTSHMRTHTADKPFACSECGRRFARQHDRNRHEKLHWGIKPYACEYCKKPFARMDALNRHLRVENGCQQKLQQLQQESLTHI